MIGEKDKDLPIFGDRQTDKFDERKPKQNEYGFLRMGIVDHRITEIGEGMRMVKP